MKSPFKYSRILVWLIPAGVIGLLLVYCFNSQLCAEVSKLYGLFHDPHQLKRVIRSFGPYAPLAYVLVQVLQVIIAPFPGEPLNFWVDTSLRQRPGFFIP